MKTTAQQMRDQISHVQFNMNSVKGCANGDNKVAEKRFLATAIDELEGMTLAKRDVDLIARQTLWINEGRKLLATTGDVAPILKQDPETLAKCLEMLHTIGM